MKQSKTTPAPTLKGSEPEQNAEEFTPGEWYVGAHRDNVYSRDNSTDLKIAVTGDNREEVEATAKFIASAPRLYRENEELRNSNQNLQDDVDNQSEFIVKLEASNKELREALRECYFHLQGYVVSSGHAPTLDKKMQAFKALLNK